MFEKEVKKIEEIIPYLIKKILHIYNESFDVEYKKDNSPITKADKLVNEIIINHIKNNFDNHLFLSEESKDNLIRLNSEYVWVIDPIDGTKEFVKKNGEFAVNIALLHNSIPVIGFVIVPAKNKYYYAEKNCGAYLVDLNQDKKTKISVSKTASIKKSALTISRSHSTKLEEYFIKTNNISKVIKKGSSYKVCKIAEGTADFYVRSAPLNEWDICAPLIIVEEAGGIITDFKNKSLEFNKERITFFDGIICSNKILHFQILDCLKNFKE